MTNVQIGTTRQTRVIGDRWGVSTAEIRRHYPCDDLVPNPGWEAWRGVTVRAQPERLWPWVAQIRLAPYSYDWIDNLGRRSPEQLQGLPDPIVGEAFTAAFGGHGFGRILSVATGEHLTGQIMGAIMSYVLVSEVAGTRLLLKVVTRRRQPMTPLLSLGDLVMARRQLLNLARLAEQASAA